MTQLDMFSEDLINIHEARLDFIKEDMDKRGITSWKAYQTTSEAFNVSYGRVEAYYIFDGVKIKDIWYD